jgi:hypothetical protein
MNFPIADGLFDLTLLALVGESVRREAFAAIRADPDDTAR